jgi:hypothetical protein
MTGLTFLIIIFKETCVPTDEGFSVTVHVGFGKTVFLDHWTRPTSWRKARM